MTSMKGALLLAEAALSHDDALRVCGDAPPSGRCNECYGCLMDGAYWAVREVLSREFGLTELFGSEPYAPPAQPSDTSDEDARRSTPAGAGESHEN